MAKAIGDYVFVECHDLVEEESSAIGKVTSVGPDVPRGMVEVGQNVHFNGGAAMQLADGLYVVGAGDLFGLLDEDDEDALV